MIFLSDKNYKDLSKIEKIERQKEIGKVFLKLGTLAFGGPAAHIAMMDEEIVKKRKWIEREKFMDLIGATNLIPGPNSTELAIHIGFERGGILGLLLAGTAFIFTCLGIKSNNTKAEKLILGIRNARRSQYCFLRTNGSSEL